ncbi:MAG: hypothetical protein L6Q98_09145 [Anaerolineae bacterium]|nr:hypothetical protein [Anaerolineae bacterium]MCK6578254.1 hypothetical protein [Anaerolineae bacterium]NUQ06052.1 hypothetical protein [Anaerolineae bacterium]
MFTNETHVGDLTVADLLAVIRAAVREELRMQKQSSEDRQSALLELEPLTVGGWTDERYLLSREDFYDDVR